MYHPCPRAMAVFLQPQVYLWYPRMVVSRDSCGAKALLVDTGLSDKSLRSGISPAEVGSDHLGSKVRCAWGSLEVADSLKFAVAVRCVALSLLEVGLAVSSEVFRDALVAILRLGVGSRVMRRLERQAMVCVCVSLAAGVGRRQARSFAGRLAVWTLRLWPSVVESGARRRCIASLFARLARRVNLLSALSALACWDLGAWELGGEASSTDVSGCGICGNHMSGV